MNQASAGQHSSPVWCAWRRWSSWSGDGRATFHYGPEQRPGEPHIVWRRIGGHDILKNP